MKINKNKIIACYYLVLGLALVTKVATTVYSGSMVVDHGKKISKLEQQKRELDQNKSVLTREIAQNKSLERLTEVAQKNNYSPISRPIVITSSANVASAL